MPPKVLMVRSDKWRDGARTEFRDEFTQRFPTSGRGYDYRATGVYQMAADCGRYVSCTLKSYFCR